MKKFIISNEGFVEEVDCEDIVWKFVDKTTTPHGIAPRYHVREADWFEVGGVIFDRVSSAEDSAEDIEADTGVRPAIEEVERLEGWTWGAHGNFPKRVRIFDTRAEADEWLWDGALQDFYANENAPMLFDSKEDADAFLLNGGN